MSYQYARTLCPVQARIVLLGVSVHTPIHYLLVPVREGGQYNQKEQMYKRSGDNQREQVCVSS